MTTHTMQLNRRSFLAALAGLPIVGGLVATANKAASGHSRLAYIGHPPCSACEGDVFWGLDPSDNLSTVLMIFHDGQWQVADGAAGTPDLRGRFPIGPKFGGRLS